MTFFLSTDRGLKAVSYYLEPLQKATIHTVTRGKTYAKNVTVVDQEVKENSTYALIREERDFADYLSDITEEKNKEIVATNIKEGGLRLTYALMDSEHKQLSWVDVWPYNYLPLIIRIEMDVADPHASEGTLFLKRDVTILG